jgi:predicted negative regulator of RcsB-dependent stress response
MTNPLIHALVFAAAVIIPGGLLVYFAWRAYQRKQARSAAATDSDDPVEAFRRHFPVNSDSLRARGRMQRLKQYRMRSRDKTPK